MTNIIVITGGVISSLGKGIVTSSIGNLLESSGFSINVIKIDPYLNVDAGTMRPTEHGEVFVTFDGGETDQDIGTYERFMNIELSKLNNITNGQIYLKVINDERKLKYKGKCVEVVPHISQEVKRRIFEVMDKTKPDFLLIEVGGTIGDYQNMLFLDTLRIMKVEGTPIMFSHVAFLPIPSKVGEMKTKPLQHSVRALNASGIIPDMIFCRSKYPIDQVRKEKIMMFTNVPSDRIISASDVDNIYDIPNLFFDSGVTKNILNFFNMDESEVKTSNFKSLITKISKINKTIKIGIVGKYFNIGNFTLSDSYISVIEAIKHAAWKNNVKTEIIWINSKDIEKNDKSKILNEIQGIIVPGGFGNSGIEGKLHAIKYARENNIPYLGLCYGMQLALVEFARNVCNIADANTEEINPNSKNKVVDIMESQKNLIKDSNYGGTMRLGAYAAIINKNSKIYSLYQESGRIDKDKKKISFLKNYNGQSFRLGDITDKDIVIIERHRHRYEVSPKYIEILEQNGIKFSGFHLRTDGTKLMEFIELPKHKFFIATQAHPEFISKPNAPAPLFYGFIKACLE